MSTSSIPAPTRPTPLQWGLIGALVIGLIWAYWPSWLTMSQHWAHNPQYSHGYIVPLFALALLWWRRDRLHGSAARPSHWGWPLLGLGILLRLASAYVYFDWFDNISLLPLLAGLCLLLGGRTALAWAWPAVLFLFFMLPLPYRVETALAVPLRGIATQASTFILQTAGLPALAEGNVIRINDIKIGVVEACSGLSMLLVFFALSTAVALLVDKPLWERLLLVASAVPIAVIANVVRISVTGLLHVKVGGEVADAFFHDFAGWLMMPFALVLLWLEVQMLARAWLPLPDADLRAAPAGSFVPALERA
ncbi:MAG: exosortase/archaeosortase family protein [Planctomycetia bacterium]|nr:exosortase/archaeosortase family protein [Planctomycetia bacterium]